MVAKKGVPAKGPKTKTFGPEQRCFELSRDPSLPSTIGRSGTAEDLAKRTASFQAAINKRLHQRGATTKVQDLFLTKSGKYRGSTKATNNADQLLEHRNEVIQAARTADPSVAGLQARTAGGGSRHTRSRLPDIWARDLGGQTRFERSSRWKTRG